MFVIKRSCHEVTEEIKDKRVKCTVLLLFVIKRSCHEVTEEIKDSIHILNTAFSK